ncbi:MAG: hypothetical protein JW856_01735 [Dehalococcoidales bacterium]|nr:hypothetical protein [Dehalococcoidales bacterium]
MKKILGLGAALLVIIATLGVGTWAYFSDTETVTGNVVASGTLDLGLGASASSSGSRPTGSITDTFDQTGWAPGGTKAGTIYVANAGTINMTTLTVTFDYTAVSTAGRPATITGSPWTTDPTDYFDKMITATTATWGGSTFAAIEGKTLAELKAAGAITLTGGLDADAEKALAITWTFSTTATNGCQGNSVEVTITFDGTQN